MKSYLGNLSFLILYLGELSFLILYLGELIIYVYNFVFGTITIFNTCGCTQSLLIV